jgi:hypothetical protein
MASAAYAKKGAYEMKRLVPLIVLLLIVALAAIGVGYGLWYEILYVRGTVDTGTVDVEWSGPIVEEYGFGEQFKPEVANCFAKTEGDLLRVWVDNMYPSYYCDVIFDVHSIGTIPVHVAFDQLNLLPMSGPFDHPMIRCEGYDYLDPNAWVQLHQDDMLICKITLHADNSLLQDHLYQFGWRIKAWQFNEDWMEP